MSLLRALHGIIHRRPAGRQASRRSSGRARRPRWLALEALEDRLCLSGNLLVSSFYTNTVLDYDGTQGTFLQPFAFGGGLESPVGLALGPTGDLYVGGRDSNDVLRYDGNTGALVGTFVTPGSGGLWGPHDLTFGPDGDLYVNSGLNASVLRYDGNTGAFLGTFVASGSGGLGFPHGLTFGPDGNLYVGDRNTNSVLRYNGTTGAFMAAFVPSGSGGLSITTGLVFGPDGNLYVDSFNTNSVLRYDGKTGAFLGTFASGGGLNGPQGLIFGPDGNLYVSSFNTNQVLRYNGTTGAFSDVFASGGGLNGPTYLLFRQTQSTTTITASANPSVFGQPVAFTATVSSVVATASVPTGTVTFTIDGIAQAPVQLSNGQATLGPVTLSVGIHSITASYDGDPGFSTSTSASLNEEVTQAATTVAVNSSAEPSVFGQPVTFTAAVGVVAPGAGTPSGTVTFTVDGTAQTTVPLSNGQATFTTSALSVGSHTIAARYNGDADDNTSSSANFAQAVDPASTTTTLAASAVPTVFGQPVTFTAAVGVVAPGAGTPSGMVTFTIDGTAQTPVPLSNGQATFTTSALGVGGHTVTATYSGDGNFNSSTSAALSQTVNKANTTLAFSSSASPSVFGQPVTFTAVVAAVAPGAGTPTGTVTFMIDGVGQPNVVLSNGQATFTTSALGVGGHTITASYSGDADDNTSSSANFAQTVNPASSTTTLAASAAPTVFGEPVTFTAAVGVVAPGAGTPSGIVTFTIDGTAQTPVPLSNGQATFTTSALAVGGHTVMAAYDGDGNFTSSTSAALSQTVNQANTTTVVSTSADPSVSGQPVTWVASVSAVAPGAGTPTGTITFTIDGVTQPNVTLSNGQATLTSLALSVGSHSITASYNGDGNFNSSTSMALSQAVNKTDTTIRFNSSASPSVFGQPVTFTAVVAAVAPGAGTPTGTVTFSIDGTAQVPATVSNGRATFTTATLSVGSHAISMTYSGDGNFNSSILDPIQTVNQADTATTVSASAASSVFGQLVTFTASVGVVAPGAGTLTGTVTFWVDGTAQAPVSLSNGQATFATSTLGAGSHIVTATYSGNGNFNSSTSASLNQTVNKTNTTIASSSSASPSVFGQPVTFTAVVAAVAPGAGTPTGTVTFSVDGTAQVQATVSNGRATFTTATLSVGSHKIAMIYSGDGNFNSSILDPTQTVNQADTATTISASTASSAFGQLVTFTASVGVVAPGAGTLTGMVTFWLDGTAQTPVSLSNGQATFATSTLGVGSHIVTATYSGDGNFNSSTSAGLTQTVNQADTTMVFSVSATISVFGQRVTFTAVVAVVAPGAGTPTGTVTFSIDGTAQAPATVSSGQATFTTSKLSVGSHEIAMTYSGDGSFHISTLDPIVTVTKADTTTTVSASSASSVLGQPVTFTASVAAVAPGGGTPTGMVTFWVDGTAQTPVSLSNGQATFATSTLGVGSHIVTATYSGDGDFNPGTSAALNHTVNQTVSKEGTTTAVRSSAVPSVFGQPVTFTATVSAMTPGGGTPTGTVTFLVDGKVWSTVALAGGTAAFTTSNLSVGSHAIIATYNGDTNFARSKSPTLVQTVKRDDSKTHYRGPQEDRDRDRDDRFVKIGGGGHKEDCDRDAMPSPLTQGNKKQLVPGFAARLDPLLKQITTIVFEALSAGHTLGGAPSWPQAPQTHKGR